MVAIQINCGFELTQNTYSTTPFVAIDLSGARLERVRGPWTLVLTIPSEAEASVRQGEEGNYTTFGIRGFSIELTGEIDEEACDESAAFDAILELASDFADTIWTRQPTRGFAGAAPRLATFTLLRDGKKADFKSAQSYFPTTQWIGEPEATLADIEQAVTYGVRPSISAILMAQATRWGLGDRGASKSAALMLAASACEIAIKSAVVDAPAERLGTLSRTLVPEGRQAPLSPQALLEHAVPIALGRNIKTDHPSIIKQYKELIGLRDRITHTGTQIDHRDLSTDVHPHIRTARTIVRWLEGGPETPSD